jgi:hypothetical protein
LFEFSTPPVGDLFTDLCQFLSEGKSSKLVTYANHRFMSLTNVISRLLEKWNAIERWYEHRIKIKPESAPFPLADDKTDLIQILSLLKPITGALLSVWLDG